MIFLALFCYVLGFPDQGIVVPWMSSHRNNLLDLGSTTTKNWNLTVEGVSQWLGTFTLVNQYLAFNVRDSDQVDGLVIMVDKDTGEQVKKIPAKSWSQIQGLLTPQGYYLYAIIGQTRIQALNTNDGTIIDWPIIATNLFFARDYVLYQPNNVIYIDHYGPCRGRTSTSSHCAWLYSYELGAHFNNWLRMDIPDTSGTDSLTKDFDEILYIMDSTSRLWKIDAGNGSVIEIVEFTDQYFIAGSSKLSVSNNIEKGLNNYYFVQKVSSGWNLYGFSKVGNTNIMLVPLGDSADQQDGCYDVTISEDGQTVYLTCQNYDSMANTLFSVEVESGKLNFKKVLNSYEFCGYVTETLNDKLVVTCAENSLPQEHQQVREKKERKKGILILNKADGKFLDSIDFSDNVFVGLRPLIDTNHNMYYSYYYGEQPCYTTTVRKSLV